MQLITDTLFILTFTLQPYSNGNTVGTPITSKIIGGDAYIYCADMVHREGVIEDLIGRLENQKLPNITFKAGNLVCSKIDLAEN